MKKERFHHTIQSTYDTVLMILYLEPKGYLRFTRLINPLRIIVLTINSPLHYFAKFLHEIIYTSVPKSNNHIKIVLVWSIDFRVYVSTNILT